MLGPLLNNKRGSFRPVRKKTVQRMGMLGPFLIKKRDLSVRNGVSPDEEAMCGRGQQAIQPSSFRIPRIKFSVIFPSCKVNARVYETKSGHGPHFLQPLARRLLLSACKISLLRLNYSGFRPQTANRAKFIPPTNCVEQTWR